MTTTTKAQVLALIAAGKISADEGDQLLRAMQVPQPSRFRLVINPFEHLSTGIALVLGLAGLSAALFLGKWHIRFDGALDVHRALHAVTVKQSLIDQAVAWPLMSVVLWIAAVAFARRSRIVDFFSFVGVARLPLIAVGLAAVLLQDHLPADAGQIANVSPLAVIILVAVTLPALIWMVTLLYRGFQTASGLRGAPCKLLFTAGIVAAEIVSKLALYLILTLSTPAGAAKGTDNDRAIAAAVGHAKKWLNTVDAEKYAESWDDASQTFRTAITRDKWVQALGAVRQPLGKLKSRTLTQKTYTDSLPNAPAGKYVVLQFSTSFEHKANATETVTPKLDSDGIWRVSGYFIK